MRVESSDPGSSHMKLVAKHLFKYVRRELRRNGRSIVVYNDVEFRFERDENGYKLTVRMEKEDERTGETVFRLAEPEGIEKLLELARTLYVILERGIVIGEMIADEEMERMEEAKRAKAPEYVA